MGSDDSVSKARCGFVVEPEDVDVDWVRDEYDAGSDDWYEDSDAVCCWREVWDGVDDGRCIWHAEADDKPADALLNARADGPERLDGAFVSAVEMGDAIDFEECGLQTATFDGTRLRKASFVGVNGRYAQFPGAELRRAKFPEANLQEARFPDADLRVAQFSDANLRQAQFPDADIRSAQFPEADLREAQFPRTDLRYVHFSDAKLWEAQLPNADLSGAKFPHADLWRAQVSHANLMEAQFSGAILKNTDFTDTDATGAKFSGATLDHATLTGADLRQADLSDARLHDAHLLDVRINDETSFGSVVPEEADAEWFDGPLLAIHARLQWWQTLVRMDAEDRVDRSENLDRARTVYRTIQRLYRENSMPLRIDRYYVRARDTRRKQAILDGDLPRWLSLATQRWVMGYGERPRRVVYTALAVIAAWTVLYPNAGGFAATGGDPEVVADVSAVLAIPGWLSAAVEPWLTSAYFSVVTFTTVGYGDLQPATDMGRLLASVETFLGALLMALLVYVLGRRATR